ncbi:MAG: cache domain-containing protein [Spirochaetes bacterium]|nr:cache domain-containing protein [Spirochaetota bacterium]
MKLKYQVLILCLASLFLLTTFIYLTIFFNLLSTYKSRNKLRIETEKTKLMDDKKKFLNDLVKFAHEITKESYNDFLTEKKRLKNYKDIAIIQKEYKNKAKNFLAALRYDQGNGYFFAYELLSDNIDDVIYAFHGTKRELWNTEPLAFDRHGSLYRKDIIKIAQKGGGYVEYVGEKPATRSLTQTIAYAEYFKEWRWVIASSIFTDDIDNEVKILKKKLTDEQEEELWNTLRLFLIVLLIMIVIVSIVIIIASNRIIKPLVNISNHALIVADGELFFFKKKINENTEIGKLVTSFNILVNNFANILIELKNVSIKLEKLMSENNEIIKQLSEITNNEAISIEEISSILGKSVSAINEISNNSKKGSIKLTEGANKAKSGFNLIDNIINNIEKIATHSKKITNSIKQIYEITDQTDLLALNASIEAAKAGEAGKGFSVVASEIRKLADKSKETANEINNRSIENNKIVEEARKVVLNSQNAFKLILETTLASQQIISGISTAINNQASGSSEMITSIDRLSTSSAKTIGIVGTIKTSGQSMGEALKILLKIIKTFKFEKM